LGCHSKKLYPLINDQYTVRPDEAFRFAFGLFIENVFRRLLHSLKTYDSTVLVYRQTKLKLSIHELVVDN
jgi:hypothetical protein